MIDTEAVWVTILGMGAITFLLRFSFIAVAERLKLSSTTRRVLDLIPATVFSALVFPDVLMPTVNGQVPIYANARLFSAIIGGIIAWRTRNVALTVVGGLLVYSVLLVVF